MQRSDKEKHKYRIFFSHRPLMCGDYSSYDDDCTFLFYHHKPLEDMLMKYKFDLVLSGHQHDYQRLRKHFGFNILGGSRISKTFYNAPVYIISGHSGTDHRFPEKNTMSSKVLDEIYITGKDSNY